MKKNDIVLDCPYYLISRAGLAVGGSLRRAFAEAGLNDMRIAYLGALMALWLDDGLQTAELGRRAGLEPSTMTGLLDRMMRNGLIERAPDPNDRRAQLVMLTDRGRELKRPVARIVNAALDEVFSPLDEKEMDLMKSALKKIIAHIK